MAKRITIKDIAEALDTNRSTVSRALNDSPLISAAMKARVQRMAAELGYRPNAIARQLRQGQSRTIGLLVPRINRMFFANAIHGVESVVRGAGYQLLICQSNDVFVEEAEALRMLRTQEVAGLIMSQAADASDDSPYQEILAAGMPLVMFDRVPSHLAVHQVVNANRAGAKEAVAHLLAQGYRRIVHLGGPSQLALYHDRYQGYQDALGAAGIAVDPALVFEPVLTQAEGAELMQKLLTQGLAFDAVFAASDLSGLGAWQVMQAAGIVMPADKGLVGFANEAFTELIGMSSVEQYSVDMGQAAAQLLLEQIAVKPQSLPPQQILITPRLVARRSSTRQR